MLSLCRQDLERILTLLTTTVERGSTLPAKGKDHHSVALSRSRAGSVAQRKASVIVRGFSTTRDDHPHGSSEHSRARDPTGGPRTDRVRSIGQDRGPEVITVLATSMFAGSDSQRVRGSDKSLSHTATPRATRGHSQPVPVLDSFRLIITAEPLAALPVPLLQTCVLASLEATGDTVGDCVRTVMCHVLTDCCSHQVAFATG